MFVVLVFLVRFLDYLFRRSLSTLLTHSGTCGSSSSISKSPCPYSSTCALNSRCCSSRSNRCCSRRCACCSCFGGLPLHLGCIGSDCWGSCLTRVRCPVIGNASLYLFSRTCSYNLEGSLN